MMDSGNSTAKGKRVMKVLHVVGRKNHGKTTLIAELIAYLTQMEVRVGSIKHCGHEHMLDSPGKDSALHRQAGAEPTVVLTPSQMAIFQHRPPQNGSYASIRGHFEHCDIVLVEGDLDGPGPKIEVWRAEIGGDPIVMRREDIRGIVSNDPIETDRMVWQRDRIPEIAQAVLALAETV